MTTIDGREILKKDSGKTDLAIFFTTDGERVGSMNAWHGEPLKRGAMKIRRRASGGDLSIRDAWGRHMSVDSETNVISYDDIMSRFCIREVRTNADLGYVRTTSKKRAYAMALADQRDGVFCETSRHGIKISEGREDSGDEIVIWF